MTDQDQLAALRERLAGRRLDLVFVNGAIANDDDVLPQVSVETFTEVMVTNALSPMQVIETMHDLVPGTGTLGVSDLLDPRQCVDERQRRSRGLPGEQVGAQPADA
jgi:hypothetical protein